MSERFKQYGVLAQLGERRTCTAEVKGSIPLDSTMDIVMWILTVLLLIALLPVAYNALVELLALVSEKLLTGLLYLADKIDQALKYLKIKKTKWSKK